jgi:hypothetical protein
LGAKVSAKVRFSVLKTEQPTRTIEIKKMKIKIIGALLALISGGTAFAGSQHLAALPPGVELGVYDVVGSFRKLPSNLTVLAISWGTSLLEDMTA